MSARIMLVCWSCGAKQHGEVAEHPQFGFELVAIAASAGWIGAIDPWRGRVLIFCTPTCDEAARTKSGQYRLRPKRTPVQEAHA